MPKAAEAILGLDNVALRLPIAGAGSRALAAFVDYLLVSVLTFTMIMLLVFSAAAIRTRTAAGGAWLVAFGIIGFFLLEYGFFAGFEIATGGQTPGKKALGLRVVNAQGGRP